jgi:hypothetical protein
MASVEILDGQTDRWQLRLNYSCHDRESLTHCHSSIYAIDPNNQPIYTIE